MTRRLLDIIRIYHDIKCKTERRDYHLEMYGDETSAYLNKRTGELCALSREELSAAEDEEEADDLAGYPEWEQEILKAKEVLSSDDWVELPGQFEINEWEIMERFARAVEDPELSRKLLGLIRGSGAFRRFKDSIYLLGIEKAWFEFRDAALEQVAIEWLDENGISYVTDDVQTLEGDAH